jgi:hypothetical protein
MLNYLNKNKNYILEKKVKCNCLKDVKFTFSVYWDPGRKGGFFQFAINQSLKKRVYAFVVNRMDLYFLLIIFYKVSMEQK